MWYAVAVAIGILLGMLIGYVMGYGYDYSMRVRADRRLHKSLDALSLKVDLIIEGLENFIEPKSDE